jgi:lactoylglutathione lyase
MDLGVFSISLAVSDLAVSRGFYETLGFQVTGGDEAHNYLIMVNGESVIGLFQGLFDRNILTFNPGWDGPGRESAEFDDVRQIAARLADAGIEFTEASLPDDGGPGHVAFLDPDGNPILIDQHR